MEKNINNGKWVIQSNNKIDGVVVERSNEHHYSTLPSEEYFLGELAKSVDEDANGSYNYIVDTQEG